MNRNKEKEINPKVRIFLFNKDTPQGEIFSFVGGKDSDEYKSMLADGWFDTPAKLNLPKNNDVGLTVEQVENADPSHLKIMLENIGFVVMTPEQLKAEVNKFIDTVVDIKGFTDEAFLNEAVRRGLKEGDYIEDEEEHDGIVNTTNMTEKEIAALHVSTEPSKEEHLLAEFKVNPKDLNKDELVFLGNGMFKLGLRSSMLEDTLIAKITEALNA